MITEKTQDYQWAGPTLAEDLSRLLDFDTLLGVAFGVLLLAFSILLLEHLARWFERKGWDRRGLLRGALPTLRLVAWVVGLLLVAMVPDDSTLRGLAVGFVALGAFLSSRDVLSNLAASAVLVAARAVRPGQQLVVGEHRGRVVAVTLRGVEIETADGSHTFVPGLLMHTLPTSLTRPLLQAAPVSLTLLIPPTFAEWSVETLRALLRRVALCSPRRVPGTPVQVELEPSARTARLTLTPFDATEEQALRLELERRLAGAFQETPPVRRRAITTSF